MGWIEGEALDSVKLNRILSASTAKAFADSPYTVTSTDAVLRFDATLGNIVVNLPSAVRAGQTYLFRKTDSSANTVTITPTGGETIQGDATKTLTTQFEYLAIQSTGTGWETMYGTAVTISGTTDRITVTGSVNPVIDIAATYVGQASITTIGMLSTLAVDNRITVEQGGIDVALGGINVGAGGITVIGDSTVDGSLVVGTDPDATAGLFRVGGNVIASGTYRSRVVSDTSIPTFRGDRARVGPAAVQSGDILVNLQGAGYDGSAYQSGGGFKIQARATWSGSTRQSRAFLSLVPPSSLTETDYFIWDSTGFYPVPPALPDLGLVTAPFGYIYGTNGRFSTTLTVGTDPGSTAPFGEKLRVGDAILGLSTINCLNISDTISPVFHVMRARAGSTAVQTGDAIGHFGGIGHDGTAFTNQETGYVGFIAVANFTPTSKPTRIIFGTADTNEITATPRWQVEGAGHLITVAANYDIGVSAFGASSPRTGYFGTSVVTPLLNATTTLIVATDPGGTAQVRVGGAARALNIQVGPAGTSYPAAFATLGTYHFQGYNVAGSALATQASIFSASWNAWSATDRSTYMAFRTTNTGATAIADRWYIYPNGTLRAATDNSWDLGASGAGRPATGYFGTSVVVPLVSATTRVTSPLLGTTTAVDVVFDRNSVTQLTLGSLLATFAGAIRTAAPTTGTAANWKLGSRVAATVALDTMQYIELDVGGTLYKLAVVT